MNNNKVSSTVWQLASDVIENKENVIVFDNRDGGDGFYTVMSRTDATSEGFTSHEVPVLDENGAYMYSETVSL